jgi:hypothetical protein
VFHEDQHRPSQLSSTKDAGEVILVGKEVVVGRREVGLVMLGAAKPFCL